MSVAEALRWAWADELPKEPAAAFYDPPPGAVSAWSAISGYGELHSIVDRQPNRFGCIPFDRAEAPHPDALAIAAAVFALADCVVDVPDGWQPMPEIAAIDADLGRVAVNAALLRMTDVHDDGRMFFRLPPDTMIVRYAIAGIMPDWRLPEVPVRRYVSGDDGRPRWFLRREVRTTAPNSDRVVVETVEIDGWSARLRRPVAGAYRKPYLDPDPVPVIAARAEYEILVAAMAMLHADLAGRLASIDLRPVDWPATPWDGESGAGARQPKILPDLRGSAMPTPAPEKPAGSRGRRKGRAGEKTA